MKAILLSIFLPICLLGSVFATSNYPIGARAAGMGNASVAISDIWSLYHNQAGLARLKNVEAGIYYENRFLVPELSVKGLAFAIPVKGGVIGATVTHYGFSLYSETKAGLAYAMTFSEKISAGVQLNYLNTFIGDGYGSRNMISAEAGVMAELADGLTLGAHIYNPTRARISHYDNERVPTIMRLGLNYKLSEKVLLCVETLKDTEHKPMFKVGMEYQVVENVFIRAGVSSNPALSTFGFGFNLKQFKLDFASSVHSVLGYSPQIGLNYTF
ncbi:MAG: hypothetical protein H0X62_03770 [Bacteroidetes bacterium]|nr:hypothetical protein [Bacteroidota bacterium]